MAHDSPETPLRLWPVKLMMVGLFIIWSNAFTAIGHLRDIFEPMELVLARFLPVAAVCSVYLLSSSKLRGQAVSALRESPAKLAGMALTGVVGYNYFIYLGQSEIKPGAAALVTTLAPLFTMILAVAFLREKVSVTRIAGTLIAFAGMVVVLGWGRVGMGRVTGIEHAEIRYMLIAMMAPLSWSVYTILGKDLIGKRPPSVVTCLPVVLGTIPLLLAATPAFFAKLPAMQASHWIALAYLSFASTMLGFFIWNLALRYLTASSVSCYIYLNPPFAALFGWALFGERVTVWFLAGSAIVIAGLWLTQSRPARR